MKAKEQIRKQEAGGMKLPRLHGHTKITLTDVKTGEQEIVEKDNLVTTFVSDVFENNVFGGANYDDLTPLRKLFGGVLCFEDELNSNAKLIPSELDNKMTCHAGQTSHSSQSTTRGNPNGVLSEEIDDGKGYRFVWDFSTSQGNGTISALALCHQWGGDYGGKPIEAIANEYPLVCSSNKTKSLNGTEYTFFYDHFYDALLSVDIENGTGIHVYLDGDTLYVTEVSLNFKNQGINNDLGNASAGTVHEITLSRTFSSEYASVSTDGNFIYVTQANSQGGHTLYIDKISMQDWSVTDMSITEAEMSLGYVRSLQNYFKAAQIVNRSIISDGYLYALASTLRTYYKISLTNTADITILDTLLTEDIVDNIWGMNEIAEGVLVGANFIVNGNTVYPCTLTPISFVFNFYDSTYTDQTRKMGRLIRDGSRFYLWGYSYEGQEGYRVNMYNCIGFPALYLGTIQNLNSPIVKTSDKTMQIEYSITLKEEM